MTAGLLTDEAERFPLGARNGVIRPTDPISDSATTPFGLTLRTTPNQRNTVAVHVAGTGITMATEKVTEITTDGSGEDEDTHFDVANDI